MTLTASPLLVLSNREPYRPALLDASGLTWEAAIGGLTAALDPVLRQRGGTWIAWGDGHPEAAAVDLPVGDPRYRLLRLQLSEAELNGYYHGLANGGLWPLSHYSLERTRYRREDWATYAHVNRSFAQAALEAYRPDSVIWVHDYQLSLVPGFLRPILPEARIGFFWHIPWPAPEVFCTFPWAREVLEGVLGADLVGVHTSEYQANFIESCRRVLGREPDGDAVLHRGRRVRVEVRPVGVEAADWIALGRDPGVLAAARRVREEVGGGRILLGVDRLDYSKGIPERLEAFEEYLSRHPEEHGCVTMLQVAVPSREQVSSYRELRDRVEGLIGRVNGRFGRRGWAPVHYHYRGLERRELAAHYAAADAVLITPLRDGLNLVAKEFACVSRSGALVLSEFAGAAAELSGATLVNPFDRESAADRIRAALEMPVRERVRRLERMRAHLIVNDLAAWANGFLQSLAAPSRPIALVDAALSDLERRR